MFLLQGGNTLILQVGRHLSFVTLDESLFRRKLIKQESFGIIFEKENLLSFEITSMHLYVIGIDLVLVVVGLYSET